MSMTFKTGDMFREDVEAIVNTVNCVGVMGKGVALEFKRRWPENYKAYKLLCAQKRIEPGKMFVFERPSLLADGGPRYLINFPTKKHWRGKSTLAYIEDGLDDLVRQITSHQIESIALPPLGCGNGGLDWGLVKPIIQEKLSQLSGVKVVVFSPNNVDEAEFADSSRARRMTVERAILVKSFAELEPYFEGPLNRLVTQKIVYFLQALGINYNLAFSRNLYGPYSETLRKALINMDESGFISGFTSEERIIKVPASSYAQAEEYLKDNPYEVAETVVKKLGLLIEGFESPFGMELLSTVHYLANQEHCKPVEKVISTMAEWSERKRTTFSEGSIRSAYSRLETDGLIH